MDVGEKSFDVNPGDVILIPDGDFHRVYNRSNYEQLIFICVFDGKRYH
jgi:mannose-6-phosphate isomerase-like protein (cupin superfamily)